jgi:outer membrane receptor protein involved in Fe transport
VDLSVDNIFDTKYVDHLSRLKSYALNPGRSFNLEFTVPFRLK